MILGVEIGGGAEDRIAFEKEERNSKPCFKEAFEDNQSSHVISWHFWRMIM